MSDAPANRAYPTGFAASHPHALPLSDEADHGTKPDDPAGSSPGYESEDRLTPCSCSRPATCRYGLPDGSCALVRADAGPCTLDEIAAVLGLCRERVRTIERQALETFARRALAAEVIDRLPRWGERTVHEYPERDPKPDDDQGDDEIRAERCSVVDFSPGTDEAACEVVWTIVLKLDGSATNYPTASFRARGPAEDPAEKLADREESIGELGEGQLFVAAGAVRR